MAASPSPLSSRRAALAAGLLSLLCAAVGVLHLSSSASAVRHEEHPVRLGAIHLHNATSSLGKIIEPDMIATLLSGMFVTLEVMSVDLHSSEPTDDEESHFVMPGTHTYMHLPHMRFRTYWHAAKDAPIAHMTMQGANGISSASSSSAGASATASAATAAAAGGKGGFQGKPDAKLVRMVDSFWKDVIPSVHDKVDELFYCPLLGHQTRHVLKFKAKIVEVQEAMIKRRFAPMMVRRSDNRSLQKKLRNMELVGLLSVPGKIKESQIVMVLRRQTYR